jgi:hypothetical protein
MSSAQDTKAARPSGNRGPVVQRCYDVTPEACMRAVSLLLQSPVEKKKAAEGHHPDSRDAKEGFLKHE